MINYLKSFIYSTITLIISLIIITILNYFNIIKGNLLNIFLLLIPLLSVIIGSFLIGKQTENKGYIEGLKYGIIWSLILLITNLLTKSFNISTILYLMILILTSVAAAIIGINKKSK